MKSMLQELKHNSPYSPALTTTSKDSEEFRVQNTVQTVEKQAHVPPFIFFLSYPYNQDHIFFFPFNIIELIP